MSERDEEGIEEKIVCWDIRFDCVCLIGCCVPCASFSSTQLQSEPDRWLIFRCFRALTYRDTPEKSFGQPQSFSHYIFYLYIMMFGVIKKMKWHKKKMDHSQCICMVTSLVTGSINGDPWAWHTNRDPTKLRGITRINKLLMTAPVAADWWLVPANSVSMCHHVTCADGHNQQQFNILLSIYFQLFLGSYFFFMLTI